MQDYRLNLEEGEDVDLRALGAFSPEPSGRWRIGEWVKTNRRLLFLQRGTTKFSVRCDSLVEIAPGKREHSFNEKPCLKFFFNDGEDNKIFWLITPDIDSWEEKFSEYLKGSLTEEDCSKIAHCLSCEAEKILWHLYRRRHATISELTDVVGAESHLEVLTIIRKEINQVSQDLIGRSVLVFKPESVDQKGQKIAYNWWFVPQTGSRFAATGGQVTKDSPFYDVIDEGAFYRIIIEAPPNAEVKMTDNQLCLQNQNGFTYSIDLPSNTSKSIHNKSCRNGMLEVCVEKQV